jgi:serine/threonine protein kinase/Tfp pilus assembly protein PilF
VIGETIFQYRILKTLGAGGMGEVYLAVDTKLDRKVALKFLPESRQRDQEMKSRFIREAQAAAALNHPNIAPIYEVSDHEGRPFFAMEYVEGGSLRSLIAAGELRWDQIQTITTQICEGLRAAHEGGVIHGDIKPANILIDQSGRVRLVDFGLARGITEPMPPAQDVTLGTIAFASPEQLQGEPLCPASDLFSLGVVLYQMITGNLPFAGRYEAAVMHAVVNVGPPAVSSVRPDVPSWLELIVVRLLEKKASDRYQSAAELLTDFNAHPAGPDTPGVDARRSVPWVRYLAYPAVILLVAILAFSFGWFSKSPNEVDALHKTVAVLPFENLGPPEDEYFADGMTDAVTMYLAQYGDLSVIYRSSSMQYKRTKKSVRAIGTELGAEYLLMATVQKSRSPQADRVQIRARLVRAEDGTSLWGKTYDPPLQEVFALQSDIGERVTRALKVTVGDADKIPLPGEPTESLEAYDLYLRGNEYFNRGWDPDIIQIAIELYERAIALDSEFAVAYTMLSRGHASMYSENYDRSETRLQAAEVAARKAVSLDPNLAEAHLALGYYYYATMAYDEALAEFAIVKETQPNNRYVYNAIAAAERRQGKFEQAAKNFSRALELDPRSHLRAFDVALTYGLMREYATAEVYLERAMLLAPDWPLPHVFQAWLAILNDGGVDRAKVILDNAYGRVAIGSSKYYWLSAKHARASMPLSRPATAPRLAGCWGGTTWSISLRTRRAYVLRAKRTNSAVRRGSIATSV